MPELEEVIAERISERLENGVDYDDPRGGGGYIYAGERDGNQLLIPYKDGLHFEVTVKVVRLDEQEVKVRKP